MTRLEQQHLKVAVVFELWNSRGIRKGEEIAWYANGETIVRNENTSSTAYAYGFFLSEFEKLVIPAIEEHRHTYTEAFGFSPLKKSEKQEMRSINMLCFL